MYSLNTALMKLSKIHKSQLHYSYTCIELILAVATHHHIGILISTQVQCISVFGCKQRTFNL